MHPCPPPSILPIVVPMTDLYIAIGLTLGIADALYWMLKT
jgi:hypothetical protein